MQTFILDMIKWRSYRDIPSYKRYPFFGIIIAIMTEKLKKVWGLNLAISLPPLTPLCPYRCIKKLVTFSISQTSYICKQK